MKSTPTFSRNTSTRRALLGIALGAAVMIGQPASADGLSALDGFLKKAAEVLKNPTTIPGVDPNSQETSAADTRIQVPNYLYSSSTTRNSRLRDLFVSAPRPSWDTLDPKRVQATHDLGYPRLAVRFVKYGPDLPCWKIRAYVWDDAKTMSEEAGEVCRGPIWTKDSVGQTASLSSMELSGIERWVTQGAGLWTDSFKNTGELRTLGPNPPAKPFDFDFADPELIVALSQVVTRLAVHTGYMTKDDPDRPVDHRLWGIDFESRGLVPSDRPRDPLDRFESPPEFVSTPPL